MVLPVSTQVCGGLARWSGTVVWQTAQSHGFHRRDRPSVRQVESCFPVHPAHSLAWIVPVRRPADFDLFSVALVGCSASEYGGA
ncbi:MAG: hypothetical protein CMJ75_02295 [Planctomycetaceae bacterium]|nr:hypothetical protein [Planctomycetaceae bacterium]